MKKQSCKFLAVLLSVIMCLSMLPMVTLTAFAQESGNDGTFAYFAENGEATIQYLLDGGTAGVVEVPDFIGGYPVTGIWSYAFYGCSEVTNVVLPESLKTISDGAFWECTSLTSISIPASVSQIGDRVLYGCSALETIVVDENNEVYYSVGNCLIEKATKTLIAGCNNSIIPQNENIETISAYAFYGCTGLDEIVIPNTVTDIEDMAFYGCTGITSICLPDSVNAIGEGAFAFCTNLTSAIIPNSVKAIGAGAFFNCENLTSIAISDSVTEIGVSAFEYTGYYNDPSNWINGVLYIGNHLIDADENVISGEYRVRPNTKCIQDAAFSGCTELTSTVFTDNVQTIGSMAFMGCTGLTEVVIPDTVTSIGFEAFSGCTGITSVYIPDSVKTIRGEAFRDCSELTSIVIPNSVAEIGQSAFQNCENLTSVSIADSVKKIGTAAFLNTGYYNEPSNWDNKVLYIGNYLIEAEDALSGAYEVRPNTRCIADSAFNSSNLTSVIIPDTVCAIDRMTFYNCKSLESVVIYGSVTSIGEDAFMNCQSLSSVTLPASLTVVESHAFDTGVPARTIDVYYGGTEETKAAINIDNDNLNNRYLIEADWHYNYVPPCEHAQTSIRNAYSATCTENGYTGDTCCTVCGKKFAVGAVIPATGHSAEWKVTVKPTLDEEGLKSQICTECGEVLNTEIIAALGTTYDISAEGTKVGAVVGADEGASISVSPSANSNLPENCEVVAAQEEITEDSVTYEIHLVDAGDTVQPDATVLVKLPIPSTLAGKEFNIYRQEGAGQPKTKMDITIIDGYAYFETEHFSLYDLVEIPADDLSNKEVFCGHSISTDGSININYFLDMTEIGLTNEDIINGTKSVTVNFAWATDHSPCTDLSAYNTVINNDNYKQYLTGDKLRVPCKVASAEMTCKVTATAIVTGNSKVYTDIYSVREYCENIINAPSGTFENQNNLVALVKAMLNYGAQSQKVFGIETGDLANSNISFVMSNVTADDIDASIYAANGRTASIMADGNASFGLQYRYATVVYLSGTSLRLYYTINNQSLYNACKGELFNESKLPYVYVEFRDIAAPNLNTLQTLNIGGQSYRYSVLDYAKAVLNSGKSSADEKSLAKALYWYNQAANAYFD